MKYLVELASGKLFTIDADVVSVDEDNGFLKCYKHCGLVLLAAAGSWTSVVLADAAGGDETDAAPPADGAIDETGGGGLVD